jgi:hypothetical protein
MSTEFPEVSGLVGLLDDEHNEIGDRVECRFTWSVGLGSWGVQLTTDHEIPLDRPASFLAIYDTDGQRMFELPLIDRPVEGLWLGIGPTR